MDFCAPAVVIMWLCRYFFSKAECDSRTRLVWPPPLAGIFAYAYHAFVVSLASMCGVGDRNMCNVVHQRNICTCAKTCVAHVLAPSRSPPCFSTPLRRGFLLARPSQATSSMSLPHLAKCRSASGTVFCRGFVDVTLGPEVVSRHGRKDSRPRHDASWPPNG